IEQIIPLPEAEDYQVKVREQSEERRTAAKANRDTTQYLFMGNVYNKRKLVLAVINQHINKHSNMSFQELKESFPDELQGNFGVVALQEDAQKIFTNTGHKRYFIAEDEILLTSDNRKIAVSTQWGVGNINNFIDRAKEFGYQIEAQ
ncbi:MAG: hypothetical protein ACRC2V_19520, partial [Xenococcaceae cyanobacterium]